MFWGTFKFQGDLKSKDKEELLVKFTQINGCLTSAAAGGEQDGARNEPKKREIRSNK